MRDRKQSEDREQAEGVRQPVIRDLTEHGVQSGACDLTEARGQAETSDKKRKGRSRAHNLTSDHPLAAGIVNMLTGFFIYMLISTILQVMLILAGGDVTLSGYASLAAAPAVLMLYKRWYRPEYEGSLRGGEFVRGMKLCLPILISWVTVPLMFLLTPSEFGHPTIFTIGTSLAAGLGEETIFRSLTLSTVMRRCRDEKLISAGLIMSSLMFGLVHASNSLVGADQGSTLLQVAETFFIGLFLGAVYLRCGNLWPCIIVHALNDVIALTNVTDVTANGVVTGGVSWWSFVDLAACIIIGAIGLIMIRQDKRAEIMSIWEHKWLCIDTMSVSGCAQCQ